ncbi:succinate dehydrogenase assembly factor 2 [Tropicimonas sp. S265A]|uniref:succinate dehydrogenase assembly factor 2 n=1 Tax=Tropicimonas sp. S265A TaxID=3415134 RepID=UPI003C7A5DAC
MTDYRLSEADLDRVPEDEPRETRIKRLKIRSWRRGIKEMDLILGGYADAHLAEMSDEDLDAFDRLLKENDQDLYQWVSGQAPVPEAHALLIAKLAGR